MQYIHVDDPQSLVFSQTDMPEIAADECLIKVHAIGVNRADLLQRAGKYPAPAGESPILGLEVSGEIIQCGEAIANNHQGKAWQVGDKVFGLVAGGGYAQYVKVKAGQLISLPDHFTFEQGAACAEVFLTAYQSLFSIASVAVKNKVLIHAGASGVGSAAIQLAKARHCHVTVTVGSEAKAKACLALGADCTINYQNTDFVEWSKENDSIGYDVIVDVVSGEYLAKNINVAALDGHIVTLSMLGGRYCSQVDIAKLLAKRLTVSASTLRNRSEDYKAQLVASFTRDFYADLVNGKIKPVIDSTYPWQQVEQAHEKMAQNNNIGKLILLVN
ncbi:NAD(P)H-quinone oxidoreductase [Colwellia psychrerythraea]|uniref:NAD(P)H quinone oxidoreductase, PIG3 family n=1 Tax=Colwellia psychrerythraea TaxID=28229 RepID=A0A099K8I7_COLPS|nr:NAD(P)H-quinone oxidoreductase [Colwellia psychrerythraea]KGJ86631.1 NAD(P)H quinone oxidoreductase, PIG3 family [Colwellia psychrerythraea]